MKKKESRIKTKRMLIQPMSDEEIEKQIQISDTEALRTAYEEMLAGCRKDPENRVWYAPWRITLKSDHTYIGDLGFKGPVKENAVEIGYGVLPEQEGKGYTMEAVQAMTQWAFAQENVVFVEAETEPGNNASQWVLEKCGFQPDGEGAEGPRFVLENPLPSWMTVYMLLGLSLGTALGTSLGNIAIGISLGLCFGLCIGAALDASAKKERQKLREQRESRKGTSF